MRSLRRVILQQPDNPEEDALWLDVTVNENGERVKSCLTLGVCGSLSNPENRYPVVLTERNEIDFGVYASEADADRFWPLRMPHPLIKGALASVVDQGEEYRYRVVDIIPLADLH